jgi:threonine aldolase
MRSRQFFSDNCAGICPEALAALAEANAGHASSYGEDAWTRQAAAMIRDLFETGCQVFFVFSGTAGVDILCLGGTKNGMAVGEAIVFFDADLALEFDYRRKQAGQLASKMRFLSAPWIGMLRDGAWLCHAARANAMARRLENALRGLPNLKIAFPCQTNAVFAIMPAARIHRLRELGWQFSAHVTPDNCRLMCSWDTTEEDVDALAADVRKLSLET